MHGKTFAVRLKICKNRKSFPLQMFCHIWYILTSDFTVLASSNVIDFSSSEVNSPEDSNKGTALAGSFFLLVLYTKYEYNVIIMHKC